MIQPSSALIGFMALYGFTIALGYAVKAVSPTVYSVDVGVTAKKTQTLQTKGDKIHE